MRHELEQAVSEVFSAGHHPVLKRAGLEQSMALATTIGVLEIDTQGKLFQPCDGGKPAVIQPITEYARRPPNLDENGRLLPELLDSHEEYLIDLLAWLPEEPTNWWTRRGEPATCLGWADLMDAAAYREAIRLVKTPLDWLLTDSVFIVDRRGLREDFAALGAIECADLTHTQEIDLWLRDKPETLPQLMFPDGKSK